MRLLLVALLLVVVLMEVNSARIMAPKGAKPSVQKKLDIITELMEKEAERAKSQLKDDDDENAKMLDLSKYPNALKYVEERFGKNSKMFRKVFKDRS